MTNGNPAEVAAAVSAFLAALSGNENGLLLYYYRDHKAAVDSWFAAHSDEFSGGGRRGEAADPERECPGHLPARSRTTAEGGDPSAKPMIWVF